LSRVPPVPPVGLYVAVPMMRLGSM